MTMHMYILILVYACISHPDRKITLIVRILPCWREQVQQQESIRFVMAHGPVHEEYVRPPTTTSWHATMNVESTRPSAAAMAKQSD
jgi:hypothetical protein